MYLVNVKRILHFLIVVFQTVFVFSQTENAETVIDRSFEKSLELIDNRKLDSAKIYLERSAQLIAEKPFDSTLYFRQEVAEAALVMRQGNNQKAMEVFLSSLAYFEKEQDQQNQAISLYQLGICHYFLNRRLVAEEYFLRAFALKEFLSLRIQTKVLQNLGTINLEEGMAQSNPKLFYKAIENYEKAAEIYRQKNQLSALSLCHSLLGECYIQLKDFDKSLSMIDEGIRYAKLAKNKQYQAFALIKKNSLYNEKKDYTAALKVILQAIKIYEKTEDKNTLLYAYNQKKKSLDALGMFEKSSALSDTIWGLTVSIYNQRVADGIAEMEIKYKTAEKEKALAQQELSIQNKNIFALILGGSIIILGIIIVGLYKRHQFKQKQFQKELSLKDALAKIRTQNKLQEQRLEISRDLHDNIGSQLTFIISSIDNLKYLSKDLNEQLKTKLTGISSFTFDTIHQLRDTIWAMNKNQINMEEFHSRVMSYIEKAKAVKPDMIFDVENSLTSDVVFSSVVGMNLFRVVQESVNNAIKHSQASEVKLVFEEDSDNFMIRVTDNGTGFDKENFEPGNGLANIESRTASIHGQAYINSKEHQGTEILIKLNKSDL